MQKGRRILGLACAVALWLPPASIADEVVEDENGRVEARTEADGSRTVYRYDDQGRLIVIRAPDGTVTEYWYDEQGRQHEVPREP